MNDAAYSLNLRSAPAVLTHLHAFFERSVSLYPEGIAIEVPPYGTDERKVLTYAEVNELSDALAQTITPHLGNESIVAVLLPR
jgi:non-ribosomal peptide synthetase component F